VEGVEYIVSLLLPGEPYYSTHVAARESEKE